MFEGSKLKHCPQTAQTSAKHGESYLVMTQQTQKRELNQSKSNPRKLVIDAASQFSINFSMRICVMESMFILFTFSLS